MVPLSRPNPCDQTHVTKPMSPLDYGWFDSCYIKLNLNICRQIYIYIFAGKCIYIYIRIYIYIYVYIYIYIAIEHAQYIPIIVGESLSYPYIPQKYCQL